MKRIFFPTVLLVAAELPAAPAEQPPLPGADKSGQTLMLEAEDQQLRQDLAFVEYGRARHGRRGAADGRAAPGLVL